MSSNFGWYWHGHVSVRLWVALLVYIPWYIRIPQRVKGSAEYVQVFMPFMLWQTQAVFRFRASMWWLANTIRHPPVNQMGQTGCIKRWATRLGGSGLRLQPSLLPTTRRASSACSPSVSRPIIADRPRCLSVPKPWFIFKKNSKKYTYHMYNI